MAKKINDYTAEETTYKQGHKTLTWLKPFEKKISFRLIFGEPPNNIKKENKLQIDIWRAT